MGLFTKSRDQEEGPLVLLVGHCLPDSMGLSHAVKKASPGARTKRIMSADDLEKSAPEAALLLVNRKLDGRFDDDADGIALIQRMNASRGAGSSPAMMLVSNFADAQEAAVEVGAQPGVGKSSLRDGESIRRLATAIKTGSGARSA